MTSEMITTQHEFETLVSDLAGSDWLAIDTEFMRESTYYPKLCLIQIATEKVCTCIDVLALTNTESLIDVLKDPACTKIIHSARQDLEVLHAEYGIVPSPIFDTQIAASMLGPDEQISYAELVSQYLSVCLAKSQSRTDWMRRPLSAAQIAYALDDVRYLGPLFKKLSLLLEDKDRMHWINEECAQLSLPNNYSIDPQEAWKNVKGAGKSQGIVLRCIQQLALWRETQAQNSNRPRQWILKDRAIIELAQMNSSSAESVASYLQYEWPKSLRYREKITALLQIKSDCEETINLPPAADRRLSKPQRAMAKNMMRYIKQHAQEIGTAPALLANRKSIENLVLGKTSKVMTGWRKVEVGNKLQKMISEDAS